MDMGHERSLEVQEGRRLAHQNAMWQAPTLTLVAQAFLLTVLTDERVPQTVALFVAIAGGAALLVAGFALGQLHNRERWQSEAVREHANALGLGDLNRPKPKMSKRWARPKEWPGWVFWEATFVLFLVADIVALVLTNHRA